MPAGRGARRRSWRWLLGGLGLAALLTGVVPHPAEAAPEPSAPAPAPGEERARRDDIRRRQAEVAAQLDELNASDDQLESALGSLDANLRTEQARADDAARAAEDAQAWADRAQAEADHTAQEVDRLRDAVRRRAVDLYVDPAGQTKMADDLLAGDDLTETERRRALVAVATGHDADTMDRYGAAKATLDEQRHTADQARGQAQTQRQEVEARVEDLRTARQQQADLKAALDRRIASYQAETSQLAAEDAALGALIRQRQAEAAAAAQAQAAQAAQAAQQAAAAPSTTAAAGGPGTSAAPGTTGPAGTAAPGSSAPAGTAAPGPAPTTGAPAPAPPPTSRPGRLIFPTSGTVTSEYGMRWGRLHAGLDISAPIGTPIVAAAGGTVIFAGWNGGGYGNLVVIDHGGGLSTAYAHQSRVAASVGQRVSAGQVIGYVGSTGSSTGPHLHFETRENGNAVNPRRYL
ncbi:MAG: peptidoglycan DD-metalloendopeptidase family protein [Acidimicrobiales bacterium]